MDDDTASMTLRLSVMACLTTFERRMVVVAGMHEAPIRRFRLEHG
jgi:hypothetical protein